MIPNPIFLGMAAAMVADALCYAAGAPVADDAPSCVLNAVFFIAVAMVTGSRK